MAVCFFSFGTSLYAENRISVETVSADAGSSRVPVGINLTNDSSIDAFSLAINYDSDNLTLRGVRQGPALQPLGVQFFNPKIDHDAGTLVLGVIFAYNADPFEGISLDASPDIARRVVVLDFDVAENAPPGVNPISLSATSLGAPPIRNALSESGQTQYPMLTSGGIDVTNDNILRLSSSSVSPGSNLVMTASAQHVEALEGLSVAHLYDKDVFTFLTATVEGTDASVNVFPREIEQIIIHNDPNFSPTQGRIAIGMVVDRVPPFEGQTIPASPDNFQSVMRISFSTENNPLLLDTSRTMTLHNVEDPLAVNNQFTINSQSYAPELAPGGVVTFVDGVRFIRGYVNGDFTRDISDGISILVHLFQGTNEPTCYKAADTNDDGKYDLSDSVYLFSFLFVGRAPPPEPTDTCGVDPTEDELTCNTTVQCP